MRAGARRIGAHFQVFLDAHVAEQLPAFRHQHQPARGLVMRRQPRHVLALEDHAAAVRPDAAGDGAQARGLAGAVGAEQRRHGATRDLERDAPQHLHVVVAGLERLDLQQRFAHAGRLHRFASAWHRRDRP